MFCILTCNLAYFNHQTQRLFTLVLKILFKPSKPIRRYTEHMNSKEFIVFFYIIKELVYQYGSCWSTTFCLTYLMLDSEQDVLSHLSQLDCILCTKSWVLCTKLAHKLKHALYASCTWMNAKCSSLLVSHIWGRIAQKVGCQLKKSWRNGKFGWLYILFNLLNSKLAGVN